MRRIETAADALVAGLVALVLAAFMIMVIGTALGAFAPASGDGVAAEAGGVPVTRPNDGGAAGYAGY